MDAKTATLVRDRAGDRCEYCRLHQSDSLFFRHHLEHIRPRKHGGTDVAENLALACHHCNLHKGPNLTGVDPESSQVVELFNPRAQEWKTHFEQRGVHIVGLTPVGRASVRVLSMNAPGRLQLRGRARSG
jgi:hypothetical protein